MSHSNPSSAVFFPWGADPRRLHHLGSLARWVFCSGQPMIGTAGHWRMGGRQDRSRCFPPTASALKPFPWRNLCLMTASARQSLLHSSHSPVSSAGLFILRGGSGFPLWFRSGCLPTPPHTSARSPFIGSYGMGSVSCCHLTGLVSSA